MPGRELGSSRPEPPPYNSLVSSCRIPFLALILLAWGCSGKIGTSTFPKAPLVLISIDTLRADHLPAYGYRAVETPHLDRLRRDSILFEHAYSHVPLTLPSHVSLLTPFLPFHPPP